MISRVLSALLLCAVALWTGGCKQPCRPGSVFLTMQFLDQAAASRQVELHLVRERDGVLIPDLLGRFGVNDSTESVEITIDDYHDGDVVQLLGIATSSRDRTWVVTRSITLGRQCTVDTLAFEGVKGSLELLAGALGGSGAVDGPVGEARLFRPTGLAFDANDNLYVSEDAGTIRRITPAGVVSTVAGKAFAPGSDDGDASAARLNLPTGLRVDGDNTLWVTDRGSHTIRRVDLNIGKVTTVAGVAGLPGLGDTGPFPTLFRQPTAIARYSDVVGLVVVDFGNHALRLITPSGSVATVNKAQAAPPSPEQPPLPGYANGLVTNALFRSPYGVAIGASGEIYISDYGNHAIRRIDTNFMVSTTAGAPESLQTPPSGYVDGPAATARFRSPTGIVVDAAGTILVADTDNAAIRAIGSDGTVTTVAGGAAFADSLGVIFGQSGYADGTGTEARFLEPTGLALSRGGDLFVADTGNHLIRKIVRDVQGVSVSTFAGRPPSRAFRDGPSSEARFSSPRGMCVGGGRLFVADEGNHLLRAIDIATGTVSSIGATEFSYTCATDGRRVWRGPAAGGVEEIDATTGTAHAIVPPSLGLMLGLAFDSVAQELYIADIARHCIRRLNLDTNTLEVIAGVEGEQGSADGPVDDARLASPFGVALDVAGRRLFVTEYGLHAIRVIDLATSPITITAIAGAKAESGLVDGLGAEARFKDPIWLSFDEDHSLYISDFGNRAIRRWDTRSGAVDTIVSTGAAGVVKLGELVDASIVAPSGLAALSPTEIAIADVGEHSILKIVLSP